LKQLRELGEIAPTLPLSHPGKQPSVGFYNLFNFAIFDLQGTAVNGLLTGNAG